MACYFCTAVIGFHKNFNKRQMFHSKWQFWLVSSVFCLSALSGQPCMWTSNCDPLFCIAVSISSKKGKGKERWGGTEGQRGSGSIHRQIQFRSKVNMWSGEYWPLAVSYQTTRELIFTDNLTNNRRLWQ